MEDRRRRNQRIFLAVSGALACAVLVVASEVLLPFVLGLLVAYVLLPAVLRVEQLRVPRWAAILIVYAVTLGAIGGFVALVVPSLVSEGQALREELPRTIDHVQENVLPSVDARLRQWTGQPVDLPKEEPAPPKAAERPRADLRIQPSPGGGFDVQIDEGVVVRRTGDDAWTVERRQEEVALSSEALLAKGFSRGRAYVAENAGELIRIGQRIVSAISRGVFVFFMMLMLGGYMMYTHERILDFFRDLVPYESQPSFDRLLRRLDRGLAGVVRGQLIICVVNGVLSAIGFWLFDLKYWPIMAVVAAVGSLIPIFGSILSTIPAVAIGLTQSPGTALAVLAWVVGIHQLEANFLNPKIIGDAAKIHPVLVVFSLLVGEHFFQIKGALFAVPCMSIVQTFFLHFREVTMGLADPMASVPPSAPLPRSLALDGPLVAAATRASPVPGAGPTPIPRGATPMPRTRPSAQGPSARAAAERALIHTTLPAGTRMEDVLGNGEPLEEERPRDTDSDQEPLTASRPRESPVPDAPGPEPRASAGQASSRAAREATAPPPPDPRAPDPQVPAPAAPDPGARAEERPSGEADRV